MWKQVREYLQKVTVLAHSCSVVSLSQKPSDFQRMPVGYTEGVCISACVLCKGFVIVD